MIGNQELRDALAAKLRLHRNQAHKAEEEHRKAVPGTFDHKHSGWLIGWHHGQLAATREITSWVKDLGG